MKNWEYFVQVQPAEPHTWCMMSKLPSTKRLVALLKHFPQPSQSCTQTPLALIISFPNQVTSNESLW